MTESGGKSFIKNCDEDWRQRDSSIQHKSTEAIGDEDKTFKGSGHFVSTPSAGS
jgi:hypothetical protein